MKKIIISVIIVLLGIVSLPVHAVDDVSIESIELDSKSDTSVIVEEATANNLLIKFNVKFTEVNDYVKYKIVINNKSNKDYLLSENKSKSEFIEYEYSYDDNNKIVEKNKKTIMYVNIKYAKEVPTEQLVNGVLVEKEDLIINLGNEENPNTGRMVVKLIILIILLMFVSLSVYLKVKNKKNLSVIVLLLLIPLSVYAIDKLEIRVESEVKIERLICKSFEEDSWKTISENVKAGNTSCYHVGDTKNVEIDGSGTLPVRITNMSTPEVCSTEGFSQSACGFVLEFVDVVGLHRMNPYDVNNPTNEIGTGTVGGWEHCEMREFLNNDFYNTLPNEVKNVIIDTKVVSSHGRYDSDNFVTNDKIYILSSREVWNAEYGSANNLTRQVDYYNEKDVHAYWTSQFLRKTYNGLFEYWWLRTPDSSRENFRMITMVGNDSGSYANSSYYGYSPIFRLG